MKERSFDEMVAYFNRRVSEMDIAQDYKMELLGMVTAFGDELWWCVPFNNSGEHTQRLKPKAWMPLPKPYKAESEGDGRR